MLPFVGVWEQLVCLLPRVVNTEGLDPDFKENRCLPILSLRTQRLKSDLVASPNRHSAFTRAASHQQAVMLRLS